MLSTQRMSSHGGQQGHLFGYIPGVINGIGLPEFMNPGPPVGEPLLNNDENANFNNFLSDFDSNAQSSKHDSHYHPFDFPQGNDHLSDMPPTYVSAETILGQSINPREMQMNEHMFGEGSTNHHVQAMNGQHHAPFNAALHSYQNNGYSDPQNHFLHQLQSSAASYSQNWQTQPFQPHGVPLQTPGRGPPIRFGSDSHFQPAGFSLPHDHFEPDPSQNLEWLESAPNTQPNTQPSSPNWSKKRKFNDFQQDHRNGFMPSTNGHGIHQPSVIAHHRRRSSHVKTNSNSNSNTPLTTSKPESLSDSYSHDEDAEAESDNDPSTNPHTTAQASRETSPPVSWSASKPRQSKPSKSAPPSKASRKRKKSDAVAAAAANNTAPSGKSKMKTSNSTSRPPSTRVPLTTAQKKANHTNSEQRRRDATARAYADLYDLVPEVEEMGKTSTMKKLEVVVDKVRKTKDTIERLRVLLGIPPSGSVAQAMGAMGISVPNDVMAAYPETGLDDADVLDDDGVGDEVWDG